MSSNYGLLKVDRNAKSLTDLKKMKAWNMGGHIRIQDTSGNTRASSVKSHGAVLFPCPVTTTQAVNCPFAILTKQCRFTSRETEQKELRDPTHKDHQHSINRYSGKNPENRKFSE